MIDARETRQAIEFYNRVQEGKMADAIDLAPIQRLETTVEELILLVREVSATLDEAEQLWTKSKIQAVVNAAPTPADLPENSNYSKDWWLNVMIPRILALRTHLSTVSSGVTPNEIFYAKPPKKTTVATPVGPI